MRLTNSSFEKLASIATGSSCRTRLVQSAWLSWHFPTHSVGFVLIRAADVSVKSA